MDTGQRSTGIEVVLFGTPRRGGFQIFPRDSELVDSQPWRSQRSLERFYSPRTGADLGDAGGILQAFRSTDRYEMFFVRYGVLSAVGGRDGGCFGIAIFSTSGFPLSLPDLLTKVYEGVVAQMVREGTLLIIDEYGRLCFAADSFDQVAGYLGSVLKGIAETVGPQIADLGKQQVPIAVSGEFPVVGDKTSAEVVRAILLEYGGVEISGRARNVLQASEVGVPHVAKDSEIDEQWKILGEKARGDDSEVRAVGDLLENALRDIEGSLEQLGGVRSSLLREIAVRRAAKEREGVRIAQRGEIVPVRVSGDLRQARRSAVPAKNSSASIWGLAVVGVLAVIVVVATALLSRVPGGKGDSRPVEASGEGFSPRSPEGGNASSATGEAESVLRSEKLPGGGQFFESRLFLEEMTREKRAVLSVDEFLRDLGFYLWTDEAIQREFGSVEELGAFLRDNNVRQLERVKRYIDANLRDPAFKKGVRYNTGKFWRGAIDGEGEPILIRRR